MFEGILERVLQRALGDYLEGLDKKNLSLGVNNLNLVLTIQVWSGNINLENVHFKKTIFQKLKLPLTLKLGRIGKLQIIVPWRRLNSSPVEVFINQVNIIICNIASYRLILGPQSKEEWELIETFHTDFDLRDQMIRQFATQIYTQIIVKKLDLINLENLRSRNIHVRLESNENIRKKFSMGLTLKEINVHTTNSEWDKEYFDRTREQNLEKPVFKVLNIIKCGIYWRTQEDRFLTFDYDQEDDRLIEMRDMFHQDEDYIQQYKDDYLLQPISLNMRLQQNVSSLTLEKEAEYKISLEVDEFSIYLQKTQYDNVIMLMELFNDYQSQQTRKYKFLRPQDSSPLSKPKLWLQFAINCILREIRQTRKKINQFQIDFEMKCDMQANFQIIFKKYLILEVKNQDLTEQKQISNRQQFWEENYQFSAIYQHIIQSVEFEELKTWTDEIAQSLANEQKEKERLEQQRNQEGGILRYFTYFGSTWLGGASSEPEQAQNQIEEEKISNVRKKSRDDSFKSDSDDEFYDAYDELPQDQDQRDQQPSQTIEEEFRLFRQSILVSFKPQLHRDNSSPKKKISEQAVLDLLKLNMLSTDEQRENYRDDMLNQLVPNIQANFILKSFSVSLVNNQDKNEGIELYSQNFTIDFKKFDINNPQNVFTFELVARNESFGINQITKIENQIYKSYIVSKIIKQNDIQLNSQFNKSPAMISHNDSDRYQSTIRLIKGNLNQNIGQKYIVDDNVDFDLSVKFQPIQIIYKVVAISKLTKFLKVEAQKEEEIKQQAYEKLEAIKQSVSISDVIKNRKKNRIKIEVASPILIIPFKKNNDINSECWIFNMGDFSFQNYDRQSSDKMDRNYDHYKIQISQIMMRYIKSYKQWVESYNPKSLSVIREFKLQLILSLRKNSAIKSANIPEIIMDGKMSKLKLFFNPHIYNQFLNISRLLSMESTSQNNGEQQHLVNEKFQVLEMATQTGQIKKKGNTIKFWYSYFGVLSGAYLYFYEKQSDLYPEDYFYIKGGQLQKDIDKQIEYSIQIENQFGDQCLIAFNSQKSQNEWEKAIKEKIYELSQQQSQPEENIKRQNTKLEDELDDIDPEQQQMRFEFRIPQIEIELLAEPDDLQGQQLDSENDHSENQSESTMKQFDIGLFTPCKKLRKSSLDFENFQNQRQDSEQASPFDNEFQFMQRKSLIDEEVRDKKWSSIIKLENINFKMVRRSYDSDMSVVLQQLNISNCDNKRFPDMMDSKYQLNQKALIEINIKRQEKESPRYEDADMYVDLLFGQLEVNWHPKSINRIIRFFRYMKLPEIVIQEEQEKLQHKQIYYGDSKNDNGISPGLRMNSDLKFMQNCQNIPNILMKVKAKLDLLKIVLIHPINQTYPIATISLGKFDINYHMCYDHDIYKGKFDEFKIYDHTNFPLTLDPRKNYLQKEYPNHEILGIRVDSNQGPMLSFDFLMYHDPEHKTCPLQDDMFDKKIKLSLNAIRINYMQEPMFRINDYFFAQFLGALSDSNPYQQLIDQIQNQANITTLLKQDYQKDTMVTLQEIQLIHHDRRLSSIEKMPPQRLFSFVNIDDEINQRAASPIPQLSKHLLNPPNRWQNFDLKQYKRCTGLDITID
ncbi:vacuolar protein sorting-associated protein vps13 [Stylonychia lemnae]|uniref:Vacuolar protein sorting-associated protein vps13 n=1 Tax=Stylonychia lemnae TaxID=5949 RepID=A0A078B999_STYLE|nr:vacuolar protein sorting-associated protein vps13 [Stylonychia lemnae]|eukprot:CDW90143.1 vacuolar protein sorting-associated protein vps13 [Stylonychia lemnae]